MNISQLIQSLLARLKLKQEPLKLVKTVGFTNQPWEPEMRAVPPGHFGPNMPKYQPCPKEHKGSKRVLKTMGGANYRCCRHGEFFVRR